MEFIIYACLSSKILTMYCEIITQTQESKDRMIEMKIDCCMFLSLYMQWYIFLMCKFKDEYCKPIATTKN